MKLKLFVTFLMAAMTIPMVGQSKFVTVKDGHFEKDGLPYYYVGLIIMLVLISGTGRSSALKVRAAIASDSARNST